MSSAQGNGMKDDLSVITCFHAHVYYDAATMERARRVCEGLAQRFGLQMGRMHQQPVGPHPDWSCLLVCTPAQAGDVIAWLALNRDGLVVFVHPDTGDELADHRDHAIWMGAVRPLKLEQFERH
ncbi:MAG: DOPA 4,5-dioxygenase family protein [Pseudomonadota bacterium]